MAINCSTITRVSVLPDGTQSDMNSSGAIFSPDATKAAFVSDATNLPPGNTTGSSDIDVKDPLTGAVQHVSVAAGGRGCPSANRGS